MGIQFTPEQWQKIKKDYTSWWKQELDRPLIPIWLAGKDPGRPKPEVPLLTQATCADLSIPAEDIIDRIDYELSGFEYLGDAFPCFGMDCFGPGIVAAFLGAELDNSTGNVWFHPKKLLPIRELHFEYDADNVWLNRIKDLYRAGMDRWQGQVLMTMPDLGGVLDILSTFRPGEHLMMDLYDDPEEVERLVWEIHDLWMRYYNEFNSILQPVNPGYSDWARIYSDTPSYVPQCDACYMIGPRMFDTFVKPELASMCKLLDRSLYHLDGIGELNHLDSILSIREIDAIQWVPGAGNPTQDQWPDIYRKIHNAGKNIHISDGLDCLDHIISQIGTGKGIFHSPIYWNIQEKELLLERLKRYE